jgi:Reverse transcriptase (RNA-dependent DNA polymerase).
MGITQKEDVTAYAYADDIVVGSKSLMKLQNTIDDLKKWCTQHKFKINTEKTEMIVFRTGGQIPTPTRITIEGRIISIAKDYKYLGITLQPSAKCFTKHITEKATQTTRAMHDVKLIRELSLETAMELFKSSKIFKDRVLHFPSMITKKAISS